MLTLINQMGVPVSSQSQIHPRCCLVCLHDDVIAAMWCFGEDDMQIFTCVIK